MCKRLSSTHLPVYSTSTDTCHTRIDKRQYTMHAHYTYTLSRVRSILANPWKNKCDEEKKTTVEKMITNVIWTFLSFIERIWKRLLNSVWIRRMCKFFSLLFLTATVAAATATDVVQESYCYHKKKENIKEIIQTHSFTHRGIHMHTRWMNEGKVATVTEWSHRRQLKWWIEKEFTCNCLRQFNTQVQCCLSIALSSFIFCCCIKFMDIKVRLLYSVPDPIRLPLSLCTLYYKMSVPLVDKWSDGTIIIEKSRVKHRHH